MILPAPIKRRGACPALSSPMQTGDGLLVRLNPVSQNLTPTQLIGFCESASRNGNGIVEITARGSFQIRGLTTAGVEALAGDVNALGISVRTGVPVETGPLAGLDPDEIADSRRLAEAIREGIAEAGLSARLGPKVSVVVDGGGAIGLDGVMADVRLVAVDARAFVSSDAKWNLSVGGDARTARFVGVVDDAAACQATIAILTEIAAKGVDARARDLNFPRGQSLVTLHSTLPPSVLPDISPAWGEISSFDAAPRSASFAASENLAAGVISPLVGEMSGRTEGGNVERDVKQSQGEAVGLFRLNNNQTALGIALPFGQADTATLITYASTAESLGINDLRLSPGRALLALCPSSTTATALKHHAKSLNFVTEPADPRLAISACPGAPACASGHFAARDVAAAIIDDVRELIDANTTLHVSGCAKGCAHPAPASFTLVGDKNGIGLVVDGTARHTPLAYTQPEGLALSLRRLAKLASDERRQGESAAQALSRLDAEQVATAFRQDGK